jgi:hypothetical protein
MSQVGKRFGVTAGGMALLLGSVVGCASPYAYNRPTAGQIAAADNAVQAARARGADNDTTAAPFLHSAERQLASGKHSLDAGDNHDATWLLARAAADGQLSDALAARSREESEAKTTEEHLAQTRAEVANPAPTPGAPPPPPPPAPAVHQ